MCTLQNCRADLFAELRQVLAIPDACQVAKSFVNAVNFDTGVYFLQCRHYPVRHIRIKLIVATEANNTGTAEQLLLLEERLPHCNSAALASVLLAITQP